jgi:hypothetical protein
MHELSDEIVLLNYFDALILKINYYKINYYFNIFSSKKYFKRHHVKHD